MLESQRIKNIIIDNNLQENEKIYQKIIKRLEQSAEKGFYGAVFGFKINVEVGKLLTAQGFLWKSYSDGIEFEKSEVWIN